MGQFNLAKKRRDRAGAATAVVMLESGVSKEPIAVTVDRPFICLIRDIGTGTVLFLGRVSNPDPE